MKTCLNHPPLKSGPRLPEKWATTQLTSLCFLTVFGAQPPLKKDPELLAFAQSWDRVHKLELALPSEAPDLLKR